MGFFDLFKPAWMSEDETKAVRAVKKITNSRKLTRIYKNAPLKRTRQVAVERLTDQSILADIAKNESGESMRQVAVERLSDQHQAIFADIARNDTSVYVRLAAIKRLDDQHKTLVQNVCVDLLTNDAQRCLGVLNRIEVIEMLSDEHKAVIEDAFIGDITENHVREIKNQILLAVIAKKCRSPTTNYYDHLPVNYAALKKITDQIHIFDVARNAETIPVRVAAIKKLNGQHQEFFADIAKNDEIFHVSDRSGNKKIYHCAEGCAAVENLTDERLLEDVARSAKYYIIRNIALEKLNNDHQSLFIDIIKNDTDDSVRCNAIKKIDAQQHQTLLADIAKHDKCKFARTESVKKLMDRTLLADIAKNDESNYVREAAVENLANTN